MTFYSTKLNNFYFVKQQSIIIEAVVEVFDFFAPEPEIPSLEI